MQNGYFKWLCLTFAVVCSLAALWMLNDVRVKVSNRTEKLPELIENSRKTTATLKELSQDIKDLRELAGAATGTRDASLVRYASEVLNLIEKEGKGSVIYAGQRDGASGKILGLAKRLTGSDDTKTPAEEWARGARKEALYLVFVCNSKKEILERLCRSTLSEPLIIETADGKSQTLHEWLTAHEALNQSP